MRKPKLTPWFPSDVKPFRKGVYITDAASRDDAMYQHWNGKFWGFFMRDKADAMKHKNDKSFYQPASWRGLAEPADAAQ